MELTKLKKKELIEIAKETGVTVNLTNKTKSEIISIIKLMTTDTSGLFKGIRVS